MNPSQGTDLSPNERAPEALVLGIDTGGTYTDGVLLDYNTRRVLATQKSLTTRRDYSIGIEAVIEGIQIEDPSAVRMTSISTTLATNAIVEGKGKRVALLLIGYDPDLIASFHLAERFSTPDYYYFRGGHNLHGQEQEPLDLPAIRKTVSEVKDRVDALAVSSYFSPLNPEHELRAYDAIAGVTDLPVVLGHQLSTRLGSVERATTAALNASLLAVLQDFVVAVRQALERRGIRAPLMVVRGDGTLISDEYATRTPVETIHSGPAASAIGGRFLSKLDDALVVDIGGTTTDLALIQDGQVTISEEGATVGTYKTAVKSADLLSIGLGGDSHVALDREKALSIGPARVAPLAFLAHHHPEVLTRLKTLSRRMWAQASPEWLVYWYLVREPAGNNRPTDPRHRELIRILQDGPRPVPEILARLELLHPSQLGVESLVRREVIGRAGLTPTDLLHVDGRFDRWDVEAAQLALHVFSRFLFREAAEVQDEVWDGMKRRIVSAVLSFLSRKEIGGAGLREDRDMGRWFFDNSLRRSHPHLETNIRLHLPIIGIGAPAGIFLQDVADALHTDLILPEHHDVANAVGAVAGSVMVAEEMLVYPRLSPSGLDVIGYYVQTNNGRELFDEAVRAREHARELSRARALSAALRAGADNPEVVLKEETEGLDTYRIRAEAIGNPRLSKGQDR